MSHWSLWHTPSESKVQVAAYGTGKNISASNTMPRRTRGAKRIQRAYRRYRGRRNMSALQRTRPFFKNATGYLKVKQKVAQQINVSAGNPETGQSFVFRLSDLIQATEFTRLFDSYRINAVKVTMAPLTNSALTANPSYKLMTAIDLDDNATPTVNQMLQRSNVKIKTVTAGGNNPQVFSTFLRPRYLTQLYETGASTGYGQGSRKQWLDTLDPTIPHYGLKVAWDTDPVLAADILWQFYFTYYVEFKSLR